MNLPSPQRNPESEPPSRTIQCYRRLLRLYPKVYRASYGPLMLQLARDLLREAGASSNSRGAWRFWRRLLPDLLMSLIQEHVAELKGKFAMKKMTDPKSLSLMLLLAGLFIGAVSLVLMALPRWSLGLMYVTAALFLVKAVVEWFRPHRQWGWSLLSGFIVAVAFAVFLPAWAKVAHAHDLRHLVLPIIPMSVLALNLGIPVLKGLVMLGQSFRPHGTASS